MGEKTSASADDLCKRQLSPMGLVIRDGDTWRPTEAAVRWLTDPSNSVLLASHIHARCKFFGELLAEVSEDATHESLLRIARSKYLLTWEKLDPIRRRVAWFRSLELVELWGHKVVVTESGKELLTYLQLATTDEVSAPAMLGTRKGEGFTITGPSAVVQERLLNVSNESLSNRREPIGYIPRGANRFDSTREKLTALEGLRKAVSLIDVGATVEEFRTYAQRDLGVNAGSFTSMLHSLRHLEFVELVAYNKYGPTELAYACLEVGREADLVRFLHSKFAFVGELMTAARDLISTTELLTVARSSYGFGGDASEVRTRIALLADAGFLERFDKSRARVTPLGEELLQELTLQKPSTAPVRLEAPDEGAEAEDSNEPDARHTTVDSVIHRLHAFGSNGSRDKEFEATVREAFELLGFRAQHISGSGDTDVLVEADLPATSRYSAIIEAKATSQGSVPEGQINFEAIKRHRSLHNSDYIAIVGVKFARSVGESAAANGVAVITVEDLASLLQAHTGTPLPLGRLRDAFDPTKTNLEGLSDASEELRSDLALTAALITTLCAEATEDDPEDKGYTSVGNLRFALRSADLSFRPSRPQIEKQLAFLMHPTLAAVTEVAASKDEKTYAINDSPYNISLRLRALADQIDKFAITDED
jgi:hypothetical protein